MRTILSTLAAGVLVGLGALRASAAPYDGSWVADIPAQPGCNYTGTMTLVVAGHDLSGQVHNGVVTQGQFSGRVDDKGNATFLVNNRYPGTMKFGLDHFDATWNNSLCDRHAEGDRALTADQQAVLAAQRKQHQDTYVDLIGRAEAGDKTVSYAELRAEAVYGKTWDFYDTRANGLLDQAAAEVKGRDCASATETLDQTIALDFTLDSAHVLRAECLSRSGDHARAEIESDIAKGLIHSLMDSGNGKSERTAYVVSSLREEKDVLANRQIALKVRDTEIRGAGGGYYDVVHGVSLRDGVEPVEVFFDISSFMRGRGSQRAALQVAAEGAQ
jgi:hypothetical protein